VLRLHLIREAMIQALATRGLWFKFLAGSGREGGGWLRDDLRSPSIVEKYLVSSNLDSGGSAGLHVCRDRDGTLRMKDELDPRFSSKVLDSFSGDPNVNKSNALYRLLGHNYD